jgi:hypothetical protein
MTSFKRIESQTRGKKSIYLVPMSLITFHRIFIWVIFRQRDMQEYILMFSICIRMEITVLFKWTVFAIYKLRRFPIHTCLLIFCIATFSNLKTYLSLALKHLFSCHFKNLWEKRNIIVTFQSGQLTEQPKTLEDQNVLMQKMSYF